MMLFEPLALNKLDTQLSASMITLSHGKKLGDVLGE